SFLAFIRLDLRFPTFLSPLPATSTKHPASVASKRLTLQLNSLNATLTKNQGWAPGLRRRQIHRKGPRPTQGPTPRSAPRTTANAKALFFPREPDATLHQRECVLQRFPCSGAACCALRRLRAATVFNPSSPAERVFCAPDGFAERGTRFSAEPNEKRNFSESRLKMMSWSTQA